MPTGAALVCHAAAEARTLAMSSFSIDRRRWRERFRLRGFGSPLEDEP